MFQTIQQFSEFPQDHTPKNNTDEFNRYSSLIYVLVTYIEVARADGLNKIVIPSEFLGESLSDRISLISDLKKAYYIEFEDDVPFVYFKFNSNQIKKVLYKDNNKVYYELYNTE